MGDTAGRPYDLISKVIGLPKHGWVCEGLSRPLPQAEPVVRRRDKATGELRSWLNSCLHHLSSLWVEAGDDNDGGKESHRATCRT
mmetsp:Transcript_20772/g.45714  ORF Transcript_20772/g.45714 Transcript_20772/m.45714 type:complete len:85 (+) Transcript_20772:247-501(+)